MRIRFLLDENLSPDLKISLLRLNPNLDILRVGEPDAPPLVTLDRQILDYVASFQRLLVTKL
ncbi:DUF5615 family PIN-like protein [Microcystis sp. M179S2]|uniref:DUF5615 family PIN-like protein n=1 Tax=Microcystis sp. M179S2 TaxID=2771160 RepID=UPI00258DB658|nr:DUF5615 family PIN-like protein [Microcystis sp. M179S2]